MTSADATSGGDDQPRKPLNCHVDELLALVVKIGASRLHLAVGLPPVVRYRGQLLQGPYDAATADTTKRLVFEILTPQQIESFEANGELDFSYLRDALEPFEVNVFKTRGTVAAAFRLLERS